MHRGRHSRGALPGGIGVVRLGEPGSRLMRRGFSLSVARFPSAENSHLRSRGMEIPARELAAWQGRMLKPQDSNNSLGEVI